MVRYCIMRLYEKKVVRGRVSHSLIAASRHRQRQIQVVCETLLQEKGRDSYSVYTSLNSLGNQTSCRVEILLRVINEN